MAKIAKKTDPKLWEQVKESVTAGDKGGHPGQWSARKAQVAVSEYKHAGGGYAGDKPADNHLVQWQQEEWGTRSGHDSGKTGERYLPKTAREQLTPAEYARTTAKKRADTKRGQQFSAQPKDVAEKTAAARKMATREAADAGKGATRKALLAEAAARGIAGRSRMTKDLLMQALGQSRVAEGKPRASPRPSGSAGPVS